MYTLDYLKNFTQFHIKNKRLAYKSNLKKIHSLNRYSVLSKSNYDLPLLSIKCGKEYVCIVKENKFIDIYSVSGFYLNFI